MDDIIQKTFQVFTVENDQYLLTDGPDYISQHLRKGKVWEPCTLAFSKRLIEDVQSPTLIDIGANLGAWAVPMGNHIRDAGGELYAWEPQRQIYYQLCANLFINNLTHCFSYPGAIGDYQGEIDVPVMNIEQDPNLGAVSLLPEIYQMQRNKKPKSYEKTPITTLDVLDIPRADLIKIDVEGMEYEVLSGGMNWLKRVGYPPILFEVWGKSMPGVAEKQEKLLTMMRDVMRYEVVILGAMAVAQHQNNKRLNITLHEKGYSLKRVNHFGMNFLPQDV